MIFLFLTSCELFEKMGVILRVNYVKELEKIGLLVNMNWLELLEIISIKMLKIKNLKINVVEKEILKWVSLDFEVGKNYLILWKNWSGKSSLANFLMGNPKYEYREWEVSIDNQDLLKMWVSERSGAWVFLSFQHIVEIPWINLWEYLRIIYNNYLSLRDSKGTGTSLKVPVPKLSPFIFKRFIKKYLEELDIKESFLERDLNVGFSGWEKRKIEILQARLLNPKYMIFDEVDSGLDLDAFKIVAELIKKLNNKDNSIIMITHNFKIMDYIDFDKVYVLKDWRIDKEWGLEIIEEIKKNGFE